METPNVTPPPIISTPTPKSPILWILLGIVLGIILTIAGYLLCIKLLINEADIRELERYIYKAPTNSWSSPPPSPSPDLATGWKTYTDVKHNFSFMYPQGFSAVTLENGVVEFFSSPEDAASCQKEITTHTKTINSTCLKGQFSYNGFNDFSSTEYDKFQQQQKQNGAPTDYQTFTDAQDRIWETNVIYGENINYTATVNQDHRYYTLSFQKNLPADVNENELTTQTQAFFNQIISTFTFNNQGGELTEEQARSIEAARKKVSYTCPSSGWVNCMPILTPEAQKSCTKEAITWYKNNCPNFEGVAQ